MRTVITVFLAAAVATNPACHTPGGADGSALSQDEARAVLVGLLDMANEAQLGTHTVACPFGDEAVVTVAVTSEQRGDTAYTFGRWELLFDWDSLCGLAEGYPDLGIHDVIDLDGNPENPIVFTYEVAVLESGARRLEAEAKGAVDWAYIEGAGYGDRACMFYRRLSDTTFAPFELVVEKDAGDPEPFTGSLDGSFCGYSVEIPLSDFPSTE